MSSEETSSSDAGVQERQPKGNERDGQQQRRQQQLQGGNDTETRAAKFGVITFLVAGIGFFILAALQSLLGDEEALFFTGESDEELFLAVANTIGTGEPIGFLTVAAPLLALGAAVYFSHTAEFTDSTAKLAAIATAAGVAAISILMLLLAVVFEPDIVDISIGDELVGFLGFLVGNVATAGLAGYVIDEDPLGVRTG